MLANRPPKTSALLVVLGFLVISLPAAAAPEETANGGSPGRPLIQTVIHWLVNLWPESGSAMKTQPGALPRRTWAALGDDGDPDGAPQAASTGPEGQVELGSGGDPNG